MKSLIDEKMSYSRPNETKFVNENTIEFCKIPQEKRKQLKKLYKELAKLELEHIKSAS